MRLKKIKLAGFKSFVDPTSIPFPGDMTAVVGPNGCGKSNVIDAVRWVLGESSAKNLRGDAMTDVIFNGSSARKPVGQCSVELVFDNSAGRIGGEYASYNELSVKRLVTRDAQSTYSLNGVKCRKRDVTDLFLGTGLGPRSYAIIEQGMISRLIESKPQELRVFIEEAAGISKYKERRRETENRIRHTQDNLDRLNDVRDELAQQLEKLQRQAAAATRYKSLRGNVRRLKGELTALRFLKNSEHIERLESQQANIKKQLDALTSKREGDEAGMLTYKTQQSELKSALEANQEALFTTATAITRIEQNTLHAQQRLSQISHELTELNQQKQLLISSKAEAETALEQSTLSLEALLPLQEVKEEALYQAKEQFEDAENELRVFNRSAREHEETYHRIKQEVQSCHSQVQSTMGMQLRTSQRISELNEELTQLGQSDLHTKLSVLDLKQEEAEEKVANAEDAYLQAKQALSDNQQKLKEREQEWRHTREQCQTLSSSISALQTLQEDATNTNNEINPQLSMLWQYLAVPEALTKCTETVLRRWQQPYISDLSCPSKLLNQDNLPQDVPVFLQSEFTKKKAAGTLAAAISSKYVPEAFNDIYLYDTDAAALGARGELKAHQSALSMSGLWCGVDWISIPTTRQETDNDGVLKRAHKITGLQAQLSELENTESIINERMVVASDCVKDAEEHKVDCENVWQASKSVLSNVVNERSLITMQLTQDEAREAKFRSELDKHQAMLEKEETQLASLSERLAIAEAQILEHEVRVDDVQRERESVEQKVAALRASVEQLTQEKHELALKVQQLENHQKLYQEQVTRNNQQWHTYEKRIKNLQTEQRSLHAPKAEQDQELQKLLSKREALENEKQTLTAKQESVEALLADAEKGHQALAKEMQERQSDIDKLSVDIEGYRVRVTTLLEQLDEVKLSLKEVLETLPDNADETQWQQELDKNQAALSRLGAVNLAAVEEYEAQSQRKQHLDTQHEDLSEALETLQSAIRKIDKETRVRFSTTFEQVNRDLKTLFPKVFGGGSAYLALTDDDLLETGVTIMARPPGKKNSTIHLLSGGEKALTALSLVFAIFRLNPAPFCLLDEVDAPLDDANVGRFCNLVSEMSQTVQFIYITHNKIAMEMASHLTGVTMAEPGVSRMVAVDVDEAMAFAEA